VSENDNCQSGVTVVIFGHFSRSFYLLTYLLTITELILLLVSILFTRV